MKKTAVIAISLAVLSTTVLMSGNAAAASCKDFTVKRSGESAGAVAKFRKRRAERRAKQAWEDHVVENYGRRFADFDEAKNVRVDCDLNERGNTRCTVEATPCD